MQISDEMVEAARKAFIGQWNGVVPFDTKSLDADMRAALEAVAPMIRAAALEEAAKVADGYHARALEWARGMAKNMRGVFDKINETDSSRIAAAIRAMKEPT